MLREAPGSAHPPGRRAPGLSRGIFRKIPGGQAPMAGDVDTPGLFSRPRAGPSGGGRLRSSPYLPHGAPASAFLESAARSLPCGVTRHPASLLLLWGPGPAFSWLHLPTEQSGRDPPGGLRCLGGWVLLWAAPLDSQGLQDITALEDRVPSGPGPGAQGGEGDRRGCLRGGRGHCSQSGASDAADTFAVRTRNAGQRWLVAQSYPTLATPWTVSARFLCP